MVEMIIMCYLSTASVLFCVSVLYCSCVFSCVCVCVLCYVWCMHLLAEVCAHMHVGSCALVCRCQWTSGILSQLLSLLLFWERISHYTSNSWWPAGQWDSEICLSFCPCLQSAGVIGLCPYAWLSYMGAGDPKLGPHAYIAGTLAAERSPQPQPWPLQVCSYWLRSHILTSPPFYLQSLASSCLETPTTPAFLSY